MSAARENSERRLDLGPTAKAKLESQKAKDAAEEHVKQFERDVKVLLETPEFIRYMRVKLRRIGISESAFAGNESTNYFLGKQDSSKEDFAELVAVDSELAYRLLLPQ